MDISKVQFVRREDLHRRMTQFTPPEDEMYVFRRLKESGSGDFWRVSISFSYEIKGETHDCDYKLFDIYAGPKELYDHILAMMVDIAKEVDRKVGAEKWETRSDDNQ